MKIKLNRKPEGIVLAVTLGIILIFGIILVGYLNMVNNQNSAVARSEGWNQAIPVLETGIEEGLTQLHLYGTNSTLLTNNSWTYGADSLYHKARTNSDGSYYTASIQIASNPIIISTGVVQVIGISTNVTRRVKIITTPQAPTQGGINAKGSISMGPGSLVDSFNSSNPLYSSNGLYVASMAESNAMVLTDANGTGVISTSGVIDGSASTGPTGTVSGTVTGSIYNDANVQFNDPTAPFSYGTGTTPNGGTYQSNSVTYLLNGGNYNMGNLTLTGGDEMAVTGGNNVLYINGTMSLKGTSEIYIAPGSTLTIYVTGTVDVGGNGVVNAAELATQCTLEGSSTCASIDLHGNGDFIGTVDAPEAAVSLTGNSGVIGAITGDTISFTDHNYLHYDQALTPAATNFVVSSWNEF